jgi:hypothetical protein
MHSSLFDGLHDHRRVTCCVVRSVLFPQFTRFYIDCVAIAVAADDRHLDWHVDDGPNRGPGRRQRHRKHSGLSRRRRRQREPDVRPGCYLPGHPGTQSQRHFNLAVIARRLLGDQVRMLRTIEVALIPVFQFGVFSDSDLSFFASPDLDFKGRVHTNGDLYAGVAGSSTLTFHDKVTTYGNVIRHQLPNGLAPSSSFNNDGKVNILFASGLRLRVDGPTILLAGWQPRDPPHNARPVLYRQQIEQSGSGGYEPFSCLGIARDLDANVAEIPDQISCPAISVLFLDQ